jgi:flagellar hook-associated protein 2
LLSQIGISTGATTGGGAVNQDSVAGKLTLDESKLDSMLASDPDGVRKLLGAATGVDGFGQAIDAVLDPEVGAGLDFDQQISSMDSQLRDIADQMTAMDERLQQTQDRLKAQFTAMETALSSSQNQQQWLAGQIAGLSNG